jgi:L-alanine-DL-glutamate epimerase-like enolase superfamily enzyme
VVAEADYVDLATAAELLRTHGVLLAAGENHFTRDEFRGLLEAGAVEYLQPDLSEAGGFTETARLAALASAWGLRIHPHLDETRRRYRQDSAKAVRSALNRSGCSLNTACPAPS